MLIKLRDCRSLQPYDGLGSLYDSSKHSRLLELLVLDAIELLCHELQAQLNIGPEEGMLEHTAHLTTLFERLAPLIRVGYKQLLDQSGCRYEVIRGGLFASSILRFKLATVQVARAPRSRNEILSFWSVLKSEVPKQRLKSTAPKDHRS